MSAYFLYSVHIRPTVKEENPEASFGDIARIISDRFKNLSAKEKKIWQDKAAADKEVRMNRALVVIVIDIGYLQNPFISFLALQARNE